MPKSKIVISVALARAINHVNGDVVYDMPEDSSLEDIAEVCIDAGRLTTWGHPEADAEVKALIGEHGYVPVLKALTKHVCQA